MPAILVLVHDYTGRRTLEITLADAQPPADLWLLRHHGSEDRHGRQGSAAADGLGAYLNGEDTDGQNLVVWYCGHLVHHVDDAGRDRHAVGPGLVPLGPW
ncbi:hypothetical protein [Streptomyces morookaense]|uniref:Uncharacterized protein n=1 Tax=Streptomyces morookaense TaxID=1970 RepID=A0A7Y7E5V3_STRMO|nr:hypothetical protein [Streptomyces morookaense]NVK76619.1 hypothetical protein [Streptomyces morookaense]